MPDNFLNRMRGIQSLTAMILAGWLGFGLPARGDGVDDLPPQEPERPRAARDRETGLERATASKWNVQAGVAIITSKNIGQLLEGDVGRAKGDAGGELYNLTLSYTAHRFEIPWRDGALTPEFEPYATLTLVNENGRSLFPDYNAGVGFRWVDFPWNRWVRTTFFVGIGLSYSTYVFRIDRERHPDERRSHVKLDWPLHLTFAHPRYPRHQLVLFNDHHSGGHIFDQGGVNSLGAGVRFSF